MTPETQTAPDPYTHVWTRIATGNPAWTLLGIRLGSLEPGRAVLNLSFRPEILNPSGNVQGGIVTALADAAGACALYTLLSPDQRVTSIELKINFLKPVNLDARAEGRVLHAGSRTGVSYVEVKTADDVVAVGLLTFAVLR